MASAITVQEDALYEWDAAIGTGLPSFDLGDGVPSTFANRGPGFTSFGDALSYSCAGMTDLILYKNIQPE
ncbi:unnamed protein product [Sphenostylis stenocarpa]|uniref:Uncharacterized protein n=1 Tax=Sphenostylis stenocarpa TaxID=92480 RepID=A0AA86RY10_9FABA|nr:unnamed protein product [Sphenostylis stenocarpa]